MVEFNPDGSLKLPNHLQEKQNEEEKKMKSHHHPFTKPSDESLKIIDKDPLKAKACAYDMVINGVEVGGGSLRIYNDDLQEKIFKILGISKKRFSWL
jgi:aspartyl-tRNA synthetase